MEKFFLKKYHFEPIFVDFAANIEEKSLKIGKNMLCEGRITQSLRG